MMINNKKCILIVLLVLIILPRNSKSLFARLNKRATDDGVCQHSTGVFCSNVMYDEKGFMQRFSSDTSKQIQNHFENATTNCKVLLCVMAMYAVLVEDAKSSSPDSPLIADDVFINVIKGTNLIECIDNNKNIENGTGNQTDGTINIDNSTIVDNDKFDSIDSTTTDFNHLETTITEQDTQSIKPNEIDGSLNESKNKPRKGIIDILYTNENYTDAMKLKDMNEQSDTKLVNDNPGEEYVPFGIVNLNNMETKINESTVPFRDDESDDDQSPERHIDIANRILGITETAKPSDTDTTLDLDFMYVSSISTSISTSTVIPQEDTESTPTGISSNSESTSSSTVLLGDGAETVEGSDSTPESSSSPETTTKPSLSQIGNIIFQLLGEEGYNSFSCNLTTGSEEDHFNENGESELPYRRLNDQTDDQSTTNSTLERIEFQPVKSNSLPKIPKILYEDEQVRLLLVKFNVIELCDFTSNDHENWTENISNKLSSCSDAITSVKLQVNEKVKMILEKYSEELQYVVKKLKLIQESKMKIIKIINLTDYLMSTIKESEIPKDLRSKFYELKLFLLVELKNEDLSLFHPDSNRKDAFMMQLFEYLIQSKAVDNKNKKLLEMFKKYIRSSS